MILSTPSLSIALDEPEAEGFERERASNHGAPMPARNTTGIE